MGGYHYSRYGTVISTDDLSAVLIIRLVKYTYDWFFKYRNMRNKMSLFIFSLLICSRMYGQIDTTEYEKISKNSLYVELLGSAGYLYNITYDRTVFVKEKNHVSTALGVQCFPKSGGWNRLSFSPQISYFYGVKHHIELGVGMVYYANEEDF